MPGYGSYEATRQIRRLGQTDAQSIPFIALTANAFAEDIQHANGCRNECPCCQTVKHKNNKKNNYKPIKIIKLLICRRQRRRFQRESIPYICDFSRCRLNVRLTACIQPLLRGHKYRVSALFGSCLLAAHANSEFILRKI